MGRWFSRDPIGYEGWENLYAYCGGDPVNYADSDGEIPVPIKFHKSLWERFQEWRRNRIKRVNEESRKQFAANVKRTGNPLGLTAFDLIPGVGILEGKVVNAVESIVAAKLEARAAAEKAESETCKDFNQAMNKALSWLEPRGFKAQVTNASRGLSGSPKGVPIGMKTADGKVGFRVEWDTKNGAHINVWSGKEVGPHIKFPGDENHVAQIIKRYSKR